MEKECESADTDNHHQDLRNSLDTNNAESKFTSEEKDSDSKPEENNGCLESSASTDDVKDDIYYSPSSPEPSCVICLGQIEDKAFTESCSHTFCFNCLLSWSKVKAECPLCKQKFKRIVHNVRSFEDYDEYCISGTAPENLWPNQDNATLAAESVLERHQSALDDSRQREYQMHRLTYAPHSVAHHNNASNPPNVSSEIPAGCLFQQVAYGEPTHNERLWIRQLIYNEGLWVQQSVGSRVRCTSPSFYRQNPDCTRRLTQWLQRELTALLNCGSYAVESALEEILYMIMHFDIRSDMFFSHMQRYLGHHTAHFIHELYNFASSPYEFDQYDDHISYDWQEPFRDANLLPSTGSDVTPLPMNDNPEIISSNASTSGTSRAKSSTKKQKRFKRNQENDLQNIGISSSSSHNETAFDPCNITSYVASGGLSASGSRNSLISTIHDDSTDEECVIVKVTKPQEERTPEIIDLVKKRSDKKVDAVQNVVEDVEITNSLTSLFRESEGSEADSEPGPSTSRGDKSVNQIHRSNIPKKY